VKRKVAIAMPAHEHMMVETTHALLNMYGRFCLGYVAKGVADACLITINGTLLPDMRNRLVEQAISMSATHILWVDSDMRFPATALERLLAHDVPVVGVNYSRRKRPCMPTAAREVDGEKYWIYDDGQEGIEEIDFLGHGLCLVETAVYEALREAGHYPWYHLGWDDKKQKIIGEDVWFCRLLPALGVRPAVDHDLSREVMHLGTHHYTLADAQTDREFLAKEQAANGTG